MVDPSADMDFPEGVEIRKLSELGVVDLKAELEERNLDLTGNKSVLAERLKKAIEEEGGNPDEIVVIAREEQTAKDTTQTARDTRQDSDGLEDNLDEDDVGNGPEEPQDEQNNMQEMDILNTNALEDAENNGVPADTDEKEEERGLSLPPMEGDESSINADMKYDERDNGTMESEAESNLEEMTESKSVDKDEDQTSLSTNEAHENDPHAKDKEEAENDKVAGSCISEPLNEDWQQSQETAVKEEHVATTDGGEETMSDIATKGDSEAISGFMIDMDAKKESGDTQNVPEETVESENIAAIGVSEQNPASKMDNSETGSEKGEKEEKTKDKAAADSSSAPKESSSVDGDDQKKSISEEKDCNADSKDRKASGGSDATSSSRNLCVSGLSTSTRAIDLKTLFSQYGKVVGAKVVTTAKSPGSRIFGFVAMSSTEEAANCIRRLHKTELHGSIISVDWVKNESTGKKPADNEKSHSTDSIRSEVKSVGEGRNDKGRNNDRRSSDGKDRCTKSRDRKSLSQEKKDILSFDQIKERQRGYRYRHSGYGDWKMDDGRWKNRSTRSNSRDSRESCSIKEEHISLDERDYLDADCMDPDFLERETLRIEDERRREQENIRREREELRRLQDQLHHKPDRHVVKRPYDMGARKDDWPEKRTAMNDRYARYQDDTDYRSHGRYQDDWMLDRRDTSYTLSGDRDNQRFSDRSDRHSRDSWSTGYNKRFNSREGDRDWESGRKRDRDSPWHKPSTSSSLYNSSRQLSPPSRSRYSPSDIMPTGRSRLLQEFHDNLLPKLKLCDMRGHIVEFAQHPSGSRFLQKMLYRSTPAEKEMVLEEVLRVAYPLMTDTFGNYIIQKLLEVGDADQKVALATHILGHVLPLTQNKAGCQVIQKALENIPSDQQVICDIVLELTDNVLSCVWDRNGKSIVHNPNGCRVIQKILELCTPEQTLPILEELHQHSEQLIYDQCGNHVIQHMLEHGRPEDVSRIVAEVRGKVFIMSQNVYSSHVISKCIVHSSPEERAMLIDEVCSQKDGHRNAVYSMMKHKYGSYVVQKMLHKADPVQRELILEKMQPDTANSCEDEDSMKS